MLQIAIVDISGFGTYSERQFLWGSVFWLRHVVMKNHPLVPDDIAQKYDVSEWRNGLAILAAVRPVEWAEMLEVLRGFRLLRSDIVNPGGAKSDIAKKIDGHFTKLG